MLNQYIIFKPFTCNNSLHAKIKEFFLSVIGIPKLSTLWIIQPVIIFNYSILKGQLKSKWLLSVIVFCPSLFLHYLFLRCLRVINNILKLYFYHLSLGWTKAGKLCSQNCGEEQCNMTRKAAHKWKSLIILYDPFCRLCA